MIDVAELRKAYGEKLERTGSFDEAFTKAVWTAYKAGLSELQDQLDLVMGSLVAVKNWDERVECVLPLALRGQMEAALGAVKQEGGAA
jgi:hypothetical protein